MNKLPYQELSKNKEQNNTSSTQCHLENKTKNFLIYVIKLVLHRYKNCQYKTQNKKTNYYKPVYLMHTGAKIVNTVLANKM